mmetsp:Transcript_36703/g.86051  ORF Transcript_36703/g.86051 Transcript_36703/m.86051 type:complete len:351 (-) Transcript_36703:174-1226(-)
MSIGFEIGGSFVTSCASCAVVPGNDGSAKAFDLVVLLLDFLGISFWVGVKPGLPVLDGIQDLLLLFILQLLAKRVLCCSLYTAKVAVECHPGINSLLDLPVFVGELFRLPEEPLDLILREAAVVVVDGDLLAIARLLIFCRNMKDTVAVHLESDLNLWLASWSGRNPTQLELAQQVVVLGHGSLALVDLDVHSGLIVLVGGEDLRLLGGNDSVASNELCHHTTHGLNAQSQWCHIQEQKILAAFTAENASLHGCAVSNCLVGVDATVWLLAIEEVLDELLHLGDTGGSTDQDDLINLVLLQATVLQDLLHWAKSVLEQISAQLLETSAGQGLGEVHTVVQGLDFQPCLVG